MLLHKVRSCEEIYALWLVKKSNNQSECLKTAKHNCMLDILLIGSGTLIWVFCFELVSKSSFWPLPGASWPVSGSAVRRRGITPDPERKVGQDHLVDPRDLTKYSSGKNEIGCFETSIIPEYFYLTAKHWQLSRTLGRGLVVSMLTFHSDDQISSPTYFL